MKTNNIADHRIHACQSTLLWTTLLAWVIPGLFSSPNPLIGQATVIATLIFCAYFSWKSWTLLHEAIVEGYRTGSTWQPPLWIPYSLMTCGMVLLSIQVALQVANHIARWRRGKA